MIRSLSNLVPSIKTEETPKADFEKVQRDDLSAIARQGLGVAKASVPEIKLEQPPEINYRTATKSEVLDHLIYDVAAHAGLGGVAGAGVDVLHAAITKHDIKWSEVRQKAMLGGASGAALTLMQDAFETITNRGGSSGTTRMKRDRNN